MSGKILETVIQISGVMTDSAKAAVKEATASLGKIDQSALATAAKVAAVGAAVGATVVAIGGYLYGLGGDFDEAFDNIRIGTGATADALADLQDDFRAVYATVPAEMADVSQAIADYNTRLGLTGKELQDVSERAILLSKNLGAGDLGTTIKASSTALQAWNVDAADMGDAMDYVFKVSQSTGMGFNELMVSAQQFGPQLKDLGYSFEESTALIGAMEKSGLNVTEVLGAMKKSVGALAKQGISAKDGIKQYYTAISTAGSEAEAAAIASEIFGTRAGSTMASAIRSGKMAIDDLAKSLKDSPENIRDLSFETMDAAEKFQLLQQKWKLAIEPLASSVWDAVNAITPAATEIIEALRPAIAMFAEDLAPAVLTTAGYIKDAIIQAVDFGRTVADNWNYIEPVVAGLAAAWLAYEAATLAASIATAGGTAALSFNTIATGIQTGVTTALTTATTALGTAMAFLTSPVGLVVLAIGALVAIGIALYKNWDTVKAYAGELGNYLSDVWTSVTDGCSAMADSVVTLFTSAFCEIPNILKAPINAEISLINGAINAINGIGFTVPDWIPGLGGKAFSVNVPNIPLLAAGGFTDGISIAGEAGTEAVISFDPAYRQQNIGYLAKAAAMLGVGDDMSVNYYADRIAAAENGGGLVGNNTSVTYNLGGLTFAPTVTVTGGDEKKASIIEQLRNYQGDLLELIEELLQAKEAGNYGTGGLF